jgi:hypothetical protein
MREKRNDENEIGMKGWATETKIEEDRWRFQQIWSSSKLWDKERRERYRDKKEWGGSGKEKVINKVGKEKKRNTISRENLGKKCRRRGERI